MHQFYTWYRFTIPKENGKSTILVMEHVLLLIKFGFPLFVPEEPAWVRSKRMKNASASARHVFETAFEDHFWGRQGIRRLYSEKHFGWNKQNRLMEKPVVGIRVLSNSSPFETKINKGDASINHQN
ncbi:hypothetical protein V6N13_132764 [Hibiscus sabdariffa]|uniref:Uncharacterized protein n=1 Tax=Hibiscus sabdariffa TaxID=183260 RepID=A0ABR2PWA2_9ROSI